MDDGAPYYVENHVLFVIKTKAILGLIIKRMNWQIVCVPQIWKNVTSLRNDQDFLAYVYGTFENQINTKKKNDKYLVNRNRLLQYIVSNEKTIKAEICKKWNPFHNF